MNTSDTGRLETAACLWEGLMDLYQRAVAPGKTYPRRLEPEATPLERAVVDWLEGSGWAKVRLTVIGWTNECQAEWAKVEHAYTERFDWDFVPEFLEGKLRAHLGVPPPQPTKLRLVLEVVLTDDQDQPLGQDKLLDMAQLAKGAAAERLLGAGFLPPDVLVDSYAVDCEVVQAEP